jgi:2'-5' RNA ligase
MAGEAVRAFLAFEIPSSVRSRLAEIQQGWRRELPRARWTRPEGWHLTLKFLGEVDPPVLAALTAELAPELAGLPLVTVALRGTGFFPSPARPRVAWVGGSADGADVVVQAVEAAAAAVGLERETRPWTIHLTQARLKARWPKAAVESYLDRGREIILGPFDCREVVLFKSDLQPRGAVYTALERIPLE